MVSNIASATYPELFVAVLVGFNLDQSASDDKFDGCSALFSISRLSKFLSLFDTQNFLAIFVLVITILLYLEIVFLRSAVTVGGASRISTDAILEGASTICYEHTSRGFVLCHSSGAGAPLETILALISSPLWRSRISPIGEIPATVRFALWRLIFCSSRYLMTAIAYLS